MDNGRQPRCPAPWDLPSYAAYDFVEGDIRDEAARAEALEDVETVVHLAAVTNAPGDVRHRREDLGSEPRGGRRPVCRGLGVRVSDPERAW
jgi:nucleoside-diphosphate-sugar epimerase